MEALQQMIISNKSNDFLLILAANIPEQNLSPQPLLNSIHLSEVTSDVISSILKSLKNGAAGYDEIHACLVEHMSRFITQPLKYLSNFSLSECSHKLCGW